MSNNLHPIERVALENQEKLLEVFEKTGKAACEDIVKDVIRILNLNAQCTKQLIESYGNFFEKHLKKSGFKEFCKVITGWVVFNKLQHVPHIKLQKDYKFHLKRLFALYEAIKDQSEPEDTLEITEILHKINDSLHLFSNFYVSAKPSISFRLHLLKQELLGLKEIFNFYARKHLFTGKSPTFQRIKDQTELWDCGLFILFCKDFEIFPYKNTTIDRGTILNIFKKHSIFHAKMNFKMFFQSIDDIAFLYFSSHFEKLSFIDPADFSLESKIVLMCEKLKIGDLSNLSKKLKKTTIDAACAEKNSRIPRSDSSRRYKFAAPEGILQRLKVHKKSQENANQSIQTKRRMLIKIENKMHSRVASAVLIRRSSDKISIHDVSIYSALKSK